MNKKLNTYVAVYGSVPAGRGTVKNKLCRASSIGKARAKHPKAKYIILIT